MEEFEAARRVIAYLQSLPRFRELVERVNNAGNIAYFTDSIADAIRVQEIDQRSGI